MDFLSNNSSEIFSLISTGLVGIVTWIFARGRNKVELEQLKAELEQLKAQSLRTTQEIYDGLIEDLAAKEKRRNAEIKVLEAKIEDLQKALEECLKSIKSKS